MKYVTFFTCIFCIGSLVRAEMVCLNPLVGPFKPACSTLNAHLHQETLDEAKAVQEAIHLEFTENIRYKDGYPVTDVSVEYCDTDLKACRVAGEIKHDTGTHYIYRVLYTESIGSSYTITEVTRTGESPYPN